MPKNESQTEEPAGVGETQKVRPIQAIRKHRSRKTMKDRDQPGRNARGIGRISDAAFVGGSVPSDNIVLGDRAPENIFGIGFVQPPLDIDMARIKADREFGYGDGRLKCLRVSPCEVIR